MHRHARASTPTETRPIADLSSYTQERAKFDAFKKAEDEGVKAKDAEEKYINLAEDLLKRGFPDA